MAILVIINNKASTREKNGLNTEGSCDLPSICDWKLDLMAWIVIQRTWTNGTADIEKAFQIVKDCYKEKEDNTEQKVRELEKKKEKLEKRKNNLLEMRADGELSKEEFKEKKEACEIDLFKIEKGLSELVIQKERVTNLEDELQKIKKTLEKMIDFSRGVIDHDVLEEVVKRIVHTGDYDFTFYLNLGVDNIDILNSEEKELKVKQFGNPNGFEIVKENHIKLCDFQIDYESAKKYRKMSRNYLRKNQWNDINVEVYI